MTAVHTTRQLTRRWLIALPAAALLAALAASPGAAGTTAGKTTVLQVNRTMALPGVTLPPGTYAFEVANADTSRNVVLVTSRGSGPRKVHFLGLTRLVDRPRSVPAGQVIAIGEAPTGEPVPITAWYPVGFNSGHQFIY
jgi:hypothetical protein